MSTGVIFILGKGVSPILASGVKSTWPQGSSAPGFSNKVTGQCEMERVIQDNYDRIKAEVRQIVEDEKMRIAKDPKFSKFMQD